MIQPTNRSSRGIRPFHGLVVAGTVVVAAVVAFAAFSFVAGTIAFVVKAAIVLAIVYGVMRLLLRRPRD